MSHDGRFVAYGIAAAGSDWNEWKVRDLAAGKDLPDHLKWIKFSGAEWGPDNQGFFYGRFPEPIAGQDLKGANYDQRVYYHRLGTAQQDDVLVWEDREHKEWRSCSDGHRRWPVLDLDDRKGHRRQVSRALSADGHSPTPSPCI